jgi:hypothetical protein
LLEKICICIGIETVCGFFTAVACSSRHASSQQGAENGRTQQQQFSSRHGFRSSQILGEKKVFAGSVEDEEKRSLFLDDDEGLCRFVGTTEGADFYTISCGDELREPQP